MIEKLKPCPGCPKKLTTQALQARQTALWIGHPDCSMIGCLRLNRNYLADTFPTEGEE